MAFSELDDAMVAWRDFKLIEPLGDARAESGSELYDVASDPDEQRNLYGTPSVESVQRRLEGALAEWRLRTVN